MMDDILKQIKAGEVSGMQFKERILDKYDIACELVAFSNSHGGKLVVGIKDKTGETNALSYSEVQETTNLLSDIASENVVPSILIKIDTVEVEKKVTKSKTITLDLDTLTPTMTLLSKTMTLDLDTLTLQKCLCLTSKGT
mgnify:CR=1 FL=1